MPSLRPSSERPAARGDDAARRPSARALLLSLVAIGGGFCGVAVGAPHRPASPEEILLEIPPRQELADLRAARLGYEAAPHDVTRRERLIDAQLSAGRRYADPRYFGQAEALLTSWRQDGSGAQSVQLVLDWADVQQHRHDYLSARHTLDDVLQREPSNAQAHLMRAQLGLAEGRLAEARSDCGALVREGPIGYACLAQVLGMTGSLDRAQALMDRALASGGDGAARSWMLTARADMAERSGNARSLGWLEEALRADPSDQYARLALADALIAENQLGTAARLINEGPRSDAALLRLAIIATRQGTDRSTAAELAARYAEAEARGEQVHLRDLARFRLDVLGEIPAALAAARANFRSQREPWDARILMQAARAAGDRAAARDVVEWRRTSGYQDATLSQLFAWAEASR